MTDRAASPARKGQVLLALVLCANVLFIAAGLVGYQVYVWASGASEASLSASTLVPFLLIGLTAQFVDAAVGMGFGVLTSAFLLASGMAPQRSSALIHTVEIFGSGLSAITHIRERNVDWGLFMRLVAPGILGAVAGVFLISFFNESVTRPIVMAYLAAIGALLLVRGLARRAGVDRPERPVGLIGFLGGLLDVAGGGGWGPVVGGTLLVRDTPARYVVGTVNVSEFFVTVIAAAIFIGYFGVAIAGTAMVGLLVGAAIGAPLGALLTRRMPAHLTTVAIGLILLGTAAFDFLT